MTDTIEQTAEEKKTNKKRHMIYFVYDDFTFDVFPNKFSADRALQQEETSSKLKFIFRGLMKETTTKRIVQF
jgi:hypothetical protein